MNALYYKCVNERKKISKKVVEVEPTTLSLLDHCSTIFTTHSLPLIKQIFILKVNHAQFRQNNYKMWKQEGNLGPLDNQPSTLPLEPFWLCPNGETVKYFFI